MDPKLFGRGTWIFLFVLIYFFGVDIILIEEFENNKNDLKILINSINSINITENNNLENRQLFLSNLKYSIMQVMKHRLRIMLKALPCNKCINHTFINIKNNNVFDSDNFLYIFHFFIELRNNFYINKIDRSLFNTNNDFINNKKKLFHSLLKN